MRATKLVQPTIALMFCIGTAAAGDRGFNFTTVDYPGSASTTPQGINPGGDIVGVWADSQGAQHAFVFRQGGFSSFDYPGAAYTDARGISPGGDIVGTYRMPGENPGLSFHGYLRQRDGTFVPLNFPGHINTMAQRILPDGTVMGCFHDHDFMASMHGFVFSGGQFSGLDMGATMNNGATPDLSRITGLFFDMTAAKWRGYVIQNGAFAAFDVPGSVFTQPWDMNPLGDIVGEFIDNTGTHHGFLLENGEFTSISFPGAGATGARGVNPGGDIVGRYVDATGAHGFLASRTQQHNQ